MSQLRPMAVWPVDALCQQDVLRNIPAMGRPKTNVVSMTWEPDPKPVTAGFW